jgi:hypothetical protein
VTRKQAAAQLASPGIAAIRELYRAGGSDTQRVAALIEIAGAASALARTITRYRHVERTELYELVSRRADVNPVLGRGQWLPTMTFHVPEAARIPRRRRGPRPILPRPAVRAASVQPSLFGGAR